MPRFFLGIYEEESDWADVSPEEAQQLVEAYVAFTKEAAEAGVLRGGDGLEPSNTAKTLRRDTGAVTDGPFAETKEQFGGFFTVECDTIEEALRWAEKIPSRTGGIEVRPVLDYAAMGYADAAPDQMAR